MVIFCILFPQLFYLDKKVKLWYTHSLEFFEIRGENAKAATPYESTLPTL